MQENRGNVNRANRTEEADTLRNLIARGSLGLSGRVTAPDWDWVRSRVAASTPTFFSGPTVARSVEAEKKPQQSLGA